MQSSRSAYNLKCVVNKLLSFVKLVSPFRKHIISISGEVCCFCDVTHPPQERVSWLHGFGTEMPGM